MEVGDHRQGSSPHGLSLKRKTPDCGLSSADRLQEASTPSSSFNSTTPEVCCMEASIVIAGPSSAAGAVGTLQRRIRQRTAHTHESLTFAAPAFLAFLEQVRNAKGLQDSGGTIQYHVSFLLIIVHIIYSFGCYLQFSYLILSINSLLAKEHELVKIFIIFD